MNLPPLAGRVLFRPTLLWTLLWTRGLRRWDYWTEIDETLILGALPLNRDLPKLIDHNVGGIINMCAEWHGRPAQYNKLGLEQLHLPTPDFSSPTAGSIRRGVDFINGFAAKGRRVYCHCKAGRGRSATIAVCWLLQLHGLTAAEAETRLVKLRPQINRRLAQRTAVREFESGHQERKSNSLATDGGLPEQTR